MKRWSSWYRVGSSTSMSLLSLSRCYKKIRWNISSPIKLIKTVFCGSPADKWFLRSRKKMATFKVNQSKYLETSTPLSTTMPRPFRRVSAMANYIVSWRRWNNSRRTNLISRSSFCSTRLLTASITTRRKIRQWWRSKSRWPRLPRLCTRDFWSIWSSPTSLIMSNWWHR